MDGRLRIEKEADSTKTTAFCKFLPVICILYLGFLTTFTMLARDRLSINEVSWLLIKVFFGSSYLGFVSIGSRTLTDSSICQTDMLTADCAGLCLPGKCGISGCGRGFARRHLVGTNLAADQPNIWLHSNVSTTTRIIVSLSAALFLDLKTWQSTSRYPTPPRCIICHELQSPA